VQGGGPRNVPHAATFTLGPGGTLAPAVISSPPVAQLELAVVSNDGRPRRLLVLATAPYPLTVPAHGRASVLVADLTPGRYVVEVDGRARGALQVGP
jgi:hypothetical protein